jgi:hypothetical protein
MSQLVILLKKTPLVLDLIFSFAICKFRHIYYPYGMISLFFKKTLQGPLGLSLINRMGFLSLYHITTKEFMHPAENLFHLLRLTGSCISGGLALSATMLCKNTFDGTSDMDILLPVLRLVIYCVRLLFLLQIRLVIF